MKIKILIENLKVSQNVPNPFNDVTFIQIELFEESYVSIEITDLTGKKILEIEKGHLQPGSHNIKLNAMGLNQGLYFYTVKSGEFSITKKMLLK